MYSKFVTLEDCWFTVQSGGRAKVLSTRQKNVHAWVNGYRPKLYSNLDDIPDNIDAYTPITYNPYTVSSFVRRDDCTPIKKADKCIFLDGRVLALNPSS